MNKTELIAKVAETTGLSKGDTKKAIDGTMKAIVDIKRLIQQQDEK